MDNCMKIEEARGHEKRVLSLVEVETEGLLHETNKCVKRRRRSPSLATLSSNEPPVPVPTTTTTMKRSSRFRGVSRHRWTGRFEAHLWDKGSWNVTQKKKGKQGAYGEEVAAARAYDLAAIKYWGTSTQTNFPISDYDKELEIMQNITKEEYLASLRRRSNGFARGVSKYRGVARHHHNGRWEARIGRVFGNKYLYLGTYSTQEEAAHAYDIAAIEYRGFNAVTNFDLNTYIRWLRPSEKSQAFHNSKPEIEIQQAESDYLNLNKIPELLTNATSSFVMNNPAISQKPEIIERKMPLAPFNKGSSSPTALGLLLRSSVFKDLVEKTTSSTVVDDAENGKTLPHADGSPFWSAMEMLHKADLEE
ncbi:hypothetical protein ACJIZ3_009667 [Penstemon smallii]|uniref:AP2/ERF domain-containing protein n=1 Tax=Penstemon smallii TaxID=265156 RepID=A0ABD3TE91_9LAMI